MGRRKSRKKPAAAGGRKKLKLATSYDCPFCYHAGSVKVAIVRKVHAELRCTACEIKWSCSCGPHEQPIDIFSRWVDECSKPAASDKGDDDEVNKSYSATKLAEEEDEAAENGEADELDEDEDEESDLEPPSSRTKKQVFDEGDELDDSDSED